MNTPARLGIYGTCLIAAFAAAFGIASAIAPADIANEHAAAVEESHGGHGEQESTDTALPGLSVSSGGYALEAIQAPAAVGDSGSLEFTIVDGDGTPLTEYEVEHEKELHLIVVRSDGAEFHHVHPELDAAGTWSVPWEWHEAGTYRVFTDFVPHGAESGVTLSRTVQVDGEFETAPTVMEQREFEVAGYTARLEGDLTVGGESTLTVRLERDGEAVTEIEPYLGAFGHLVALRDGDLAYLHVHPTGDEPAAGELSGPEVTFATEAPTHGRYLLYFDFQVAGETHSASFVLSTDASSEASAEAHEDDESHSDDH